jgi:hypothetical protein
MNISGTTMYVNTVSPPAHWRQVLNRAVRVGVADLASQLMPQSILAFPD